MVLDGYKLTVVEPPAPKTRPDGNGADVPVTDRDGVAQFVVSLFAKLQVQAGQRAPKGEEIKVTLTADPGDGFGEDARVQLIDPKINPYSIDSPDGRTVSGIAFKALGLKHAHPAPMARRGKDDGES
ncbi:hypothetical protein FRP1_07655 [Pseudonocardia sp. EC080625-04]|uniref:hypothetical protein n=1 Tax=Pseudonocardia sp. EC080625-04 TaxID=1096868 RepID=UPI0006CB3063|nr:hypothetical protein [Pseudonocardia sp. EC080625-04]ALE73000.1 hypothetical protein FRP1_07655 [Pseudonocardia sp. EC080625-04]